MRLTCEIEIGNRLLPSFNMKKSTRPVRAQLSVGRKPGSSSDINSKTEIYLMLCTAKDRSGVKYKLKDNVEKFFARFISEGKATIRIIDPPHDVVISKADPVILKSFLKVIQLGSVGKAIEKSALSTLVPASSKNVERPKTKLIIMSRREYPTTTNFPTGLLHLQISQCRLKRFDNRFMKMYDLRILDLSNNNISTLPDDLGKISNLTELRLAHNDIVDFPALLCTSSLSQTLQVLDLSENKLRGLRPQFCELRGLVNLKLDANELMNLPPGFGKLQCLRNLSIVKNKLKCLPADFAKLTLENLDLFGNDFMQDGLETVVSRLRELTLLELSAKAIKKQRISYSAQDLPGPLFDMLNAGKRCLCGNYCFLSRVHYLARLNLHQIAASVVGLNNLGQTHAPAEAFLCSQKCLERYQKNPYALYWKTA